MIRVNLLPREEKSQHKAISFDLKLGQAVRMRVDAIPEKEFVGELDWISPIAALIYKGGGSSEKTFPARG